MLILNQGLKKEFVRKLFINNKQFLKGSVSFQQAYYNKKITEYDAEIVPLSTYVGF